MTARDVSDGVSHGENRQTEGEGDSYKPDAEAGKRSGQDCAAASTEDQPEGSEEFCETTFS
jgi:hypothetical protein